MTAPLPSSEFWLVSYSLSVTSSITGPVEKIFGLVEVAPSSINRAGQHGRKTATIWWFLNKFLLPSAFPLPGSIASQLIVEAMTSTNQLSCSRLRVGGACLMALFLVGDSSASCLSAGGFSTQLKMVVGVANGHPQAFPSLSPLSHPLSWYLWTRKWPASTPSCSQLEDGS